MSRAKRSRKRKKQLTYEQMLHWYFHGYTMMVNKHPKSARKKRVQSKWRTRYGPPLDIELELAVPNKLLEMVNAGRDIWQNSAVLDIPYIQRTT